MAYILAGRALRSLGVQTDRIYHQASLSSLALSGQRAPTKPKSRFVQLTKRHLVTHKVRERLLPGQRWSSSSPTLLFSPNRVHGPPRSINGFRFSSSSSLASSSSPSLSDNVRDLMRSVPHPVAIITSTSTYTSPSSSSSSGSNSSTSLDLFRGATVSSFNTVTLNPDPIVSFNITRHSSTFHAIQLSGLFNVHLLASDSSSTHHEPLHNSNSSRRSCHPEFIANKFSRGNKGLPFHQETGEVEGWVDLSASVGKIPTGPVNRELARLPPVIRGQTDEGTLLVPFHLLCEHMTEKTVWIGDHVVVFGRVISVVDNFKCYNNDDSDNGDRTQKTTLAYAHGKYARVV